MLDFVEDAGRIVLLAVLGYLAIRWFALRRNPKTPIAAHRLLILVLLATALVLVKVSEDAIGGESRNFDQQVLLWIHAHTVPALPTLAYALTFTGSWKFLGASGVIALGVFTFLRRNWESLLLALSMLAAWLLTWGLKVVVSRERPSLWETQHYWGASFPSGHTLNTTCFATAMVLCLARIWPQSRKAATVFACLWSALVACSRMVLGVHWPTDVMAAACIGLLIPLILEFLLDQTSASYAQSIPPA